MDEHIRRMPQEEQRRAYEEFNTAMDMLLRGDPKAVKAAMEEAKREPAADPKPKNAFVPRVRRASSHKD